MEAIETSQRPKEGPAQRLLRVADRMFYERGYAATGINELMREAGVAKASFYHHFPSKTDLIVAYLNQRRDIWFANLQSVVNNHDSPEARVLALFDFLASWLEETNHRGCAFLNTIPEFADASSAPRQAVREAKQGLREYIAKLCAEAGCAEAGDELFLLFEGATSQAAAMGDSWPVTVARASALRRLRISN